MSVQTEKIKELVELRAKARMGGGEKAIEKQHAKGKYTARERIDMLLDPGSFEEMDMFKLHRCTNFGMEKKQYLGDGVVTGSGTIDGRLVYVFAQDFTVNGGSLSETMAEKICKVMDQAMKMGAPVIGFIDCGGIRLQESVDALDGFGLIYAKEVAASGVIPQICGVFGNCGGGLSVVPALCDFAYIEESKGRMFVNTPDAIEGNRVEKCDTAAASFQSENNGCVDGIGSEDDIIADIRALVSMLPLNNEGDVYTDSCEDDLNRACNSMADMKADPRFLLSELSDDHVFFETKKGFAKNMVTGFVKLNGMTVGAVANCSTVYDAEGKKAEEFALSLTAKGCNKAAEFVSFCDAFSIPVLTLTNVNGFKNCMCSEKKLAKALARMTYAFSSATCPKVNLITGEAYGSAYVAMNSKSIGADMVYAYPDAKIGMMDSKIAAEIMYPGADAKEIDEKAADYEKLQSSVSSAAARGYVDLIIDPADTRKYLVGAFEMLYTKYVDAPEKKHGTK